MPSTKCSIAFTSFIELFLVSHLNRQYKHNSQNYVFESNNQPYWVWEGKYTYFWYIILFVYIRGTQLWWYETSHISDSTIIHIPLSLKTLLKPLYNFRIHLSVTCDWIIHIESLVSLNICTVDFLISMLFILISYQQQYSYLCPYSQNLNISQSCVYIVKIH